MAVKWKNNYSKEKKEIERISQHHYSKTQIQWFLLDSFV